MSESPHDPGPRVPAAPAGNPVGAARLVAAVLWLAGFQWFFYAAGLANNSSWSRLDVWTSLPELIFEWCERFTGTADPRAGVEGWQYFPLGLLMRAGLILLLALLVGRLVLRACRVFHECSRLERFVFASASGLSSVSLLTLVCGLAGQLSRPVVFGLLAVLAIVEVVFTVRQPDHSEPSHNARSRPSQVALLCAVATVPMLIMIVFGAASAPVDFDVREYHLQGPKEFFEAGRVTLLPHNVYTSFPFLTEMLSLLGMVLTGDWYEGALVGKLVLAAFAPLTALAIYAAGRRGFGEAAGCVGAVVYLSTPWTYRISIIAYAEGGLSFFLMATVLAVMWRSDWREKVRGGSGAEVLVGLLAGSAMACKYPALVSVVFPAVCAVVLGRLRARQANADDTSFTGRAPRVLNGLAVLAAGGLLSVGPWLAKNFAETGNPVYPLAWSVFGGDDWTPELDVRWRAAHRPPNHDLTEIPGRIVEVTAGNDWLSAVLFGLAPLALLFSPRHRFTRWLWLYVLWLFGTWWVLTHRIDRFWVPGLPVVALLAGAGATACQHSVWRVVVTLTLAATVLFNTAFASVQALCGYNAWLLDPQVARTDIESRLAPGIHSLNRLARRSGPPIRVLCVGEAAVFGADFENRYNTVFDISLFQRLCGTTVTGGPDSDVGLRPIPEVRQRLADEGITHLLVNWMEVLRYRGPGNYGYTEFVRPQILETLVGEGVLDRRQRIPGARWSAVDEATRRLVTDEWDSLLLVPGPDGGTLVGTEIYVVAPTPSAGAQ